MEKNPIPAFLEVEERPVLRLAMDIIRYLDERYYAAEESGEYLDENAFPKALDIAKLLLMEAHDWRRHPPRPNPITDQPTPGAGDE